MSATQHLPPQFGQVAGERGLGAAMSMRLNFSPNWPLRSVMLRVMGAALVLSSTGIWVLPGAGHDPDLALMKIGVSVVFLFVGLILMTTNDPKSQPDAFFDPVRRELRILETARDGRSRTLLRRSYDSIGSVRFGENMVEIREADGQVLVTLPLPGLEARRQLRNQLAGTVPIIS
jgi:hypothetical protein